VIGIPLNEAQRQAVEFRGGPLLVLAGAGSGKTRVLTARLGHLVTHGGIPPYRILAVTFTNRAAQEMRRRVADILGQDPSTRFRPACCAGKRRCSGSPHSSRSTTKMIVWH